MPKPTMSKMEANYRGASRKSKSCELCDMWVETGQRQGKCTLVIGSIDRMGTCDYWEKGK